MVFCLDMVHSVDYVLRNSISIINWSKEHYRVCVHVHVCVLCYT